MDTKDNDGKIWDGEMSCSKIKLRRSLEKIGLKET